MFSFNQKNVLGEPLEPCCLDPTTGFFRDGHCHTRQEDSGLHIICVHITQQFLEFSKSVGNDLSTPLPLYNFPGLKENDRWCLCILRWVESFENNVPPQIYIRSTHILALEYVSLETLKKYAIDL